MTELADIGPIVQAGLHRLELLDSVVRGATEDLRASGGRTVVGVHYVNGALFHIDPPAGVVERIELGGYPP